MIMLKRLFLIAGIMLVGLPKVYGAGAPPSVDVKVADAPAGTSVDAATLTAAYTAAKAGAKQRRGHNPHGSMAIRPSDWSTDSGKAFHVAVNKRLTLPSTDHRDQFLGALKDAIELGDKGLFTVGICIKTICEQNLESVFFKIEHTPYLLSYALKYGFYPIASKILQVNFQRQVRYCCCFCKEVLNSRDAWYYLTKVINDMFAEKQPAPGKALETTVKLIKDDIIKNDPKRECERCFNLNSLAKLDTNAPSRDFWKTVQGQAFADNIHDITRCLAAEDY